MITMSQLFGCLSASLSSFFSCSHVFSLFSPLSLSFSLPISFTLIKHIEEKVDAGKRKVHFLLSSSHFVCVKWTVHHRCDARSRLLLALGEWLPEIDVVFPFWICRHIEVLVFISRPTVFSILMFVLYVRVRRYTLTVDDRRAMGGDEAPHTYMHTSINWPSTNVEIRNENWKKISSFVRFDLVIRRTCYVLAPYLRMYSRLERKIETRDS